MFPIKMRGRHRRNKELTPICIRSAISHTQQERPIVLLLEILVVEFVAVYALAAGAIASGEVAALEHELRDDAVEAGSLVSETFFASAEGAKVFGGAGNCVVVEVEDDASRGAVVDGDVEVALGLSGGSGGAWSGGGGGGLGGGRVRLVVLGLAAEFIHELGHVCES